MTPPCKKHGKDCPGRHTGCQAHCRQYKQFREELDKRNEELEPGRAADSYLYDSPRGKKNRKGCRTK